MYYIPAPQPNLHRIRASGANPTPKQGGRDCTPPYPKHRNRPLLVFFIQAIQGGINMDKINGIAAAISFILLAYTIGIAAYADMENEAMHLEHGYVDDDSLQFSDKILQYYVPKMDHRVYMPVVMINNQNCDDISIITNALKGMAGTD
jgi:hypothetical protein